MKVWPSVPPRDAHAEAAARARQARLTKPSGSLGRLEALSIELAGMRAQAQPCVAAKAVIVMAADHGVTAEGVSAYPSSITGRMVGNFIRGGAAINVLGRAAGCRVVVVDIGVNGPIHMRGTDSGGEEAGPRLVTQRVRSGTANLSRGPAMSRADTEAAITIGTAIVEEEVSRGLDVIATGDMGIGNTTAAAALLSVFSGRPPREVAGPGTGLDPEGVARKVAVIERALSVNRPRSDDPLDVLQRVGGLEIAGLVGVIVRAASLRVPVVIDGFVSGAAALVAVRLVPAVSAYLIAAHRSAEPGHAVMLELLGLEPLLDLRMRLGEGTGAVLALPIVDAAVRLLGEMATFADL
jgi:nicotinate-nucleotide--dimethylbenzimidazole phosphoribosyltransferase